jgi:hypothetical protein
LGIALNIGAFTTLIMAINFGGNLYNWNDGREVALWTVGGVLLLLFALQQRFKIGTNFKERIFPADFLTMKIMWLLFALMNAAATCVFVCNAFMLVMSANPVSSDSDLLYTSFLSIRPWRNPIDCCRATASIHMHNGIFRLA